MRFLPEFPRRQQFCWLLLCLSFVLLAKGLSDLSSKKRSQTKLSSFMSWLFLAGLKITGHVYPKGLCEQGLQNQPDHCMYLKSQTWLIFLMVFSTLPGLCNLYPISVHLQLSQIMGKQRQPSFSWATEELFWNQRGKWQGLRLIFIAYIGNWETFNMKTRDPKWLTMCSLTTYLWSNIWRKHCKNRVQGSPLHTTQTRQPPWPGRAHSEGSAAPCSFRIKDFYSVW